MGQIVGLNAKCKRANLNALGSVPTPANGEYILVSSDNSMNAAGQGYFDCYIVGDGTKAATALELKPLANGEIEMYNNQPVTGELIYKKIYGLEQNYIAGKAMNANGVVWNLPSGGVCTLDIECTEGDVVKYYSGATNHNLVFFNSAGTKIDYVSGAAYEKSKTAPANTSYLRFSFNLASKSNVYVKVGDTEYRIVDYYEGILNGISNEITNKQNLLEKKVGFPDLPTFYDLFEMGGITINNSGWTYTSSSSRIRTKDGLTLPLKAGDIIGLTRWIAGERMYVGYRDADGIYGNSGWVSINFTCPIDGDYVFLLENTTSPFSSVENISDWLYIKTTSPINELRAINTGRGRGEHVYYGNAVNLGLFQQNKCIRSTFVEHYFADEGSKTKWVQSMAIANGKIFLFCDGAARTAADAGYDFLVIDFASKQVVYRGLLPSEVASHCNNAQFLRKFYYNSNDPYPLLMLSKGTQNDPATAFILRITETTENVFAVEIIKKFSSSLQSALYNGSWVFEPVNNYLYLYTMSNAVWTTTTNNWMRIYQFNMFDPTESEEVVLTASDVIKTMDFDYMVLQGADAIGGKLFIPVQGFTKINGFTAGYYKTDQGRCVAVVNPSDGTIETIIPSGPEENEGISIYEQKMYVSSKNGSATLSTTSPCFDIQEYIL